MDFYIQHLKVLGDLLPINKTDILESLNLLNKTQMEINSSNLTDNNPALRLAKSIKNIPVIYYPAGLEAAAIRFKNSMQENAKTHIISENVIESCHNGVVAWEKPTNLQPILIQGQNDHSRTKERWGILKEFFQSKEIKYEEIFTIEGNILSKLVCLILFFRLCKYLLCSFIKYRSYSS